ncbi:SDR family oxidoreductase [Sapientia aquatica]|uniref:SDR family oxidoreductase n=1 Tax=Sapientia aquatica TaxID=1549640 RepID=A0A4R5W206_9BURK|nr:SDR family oxidoreductase [Sapientia aquatica]TDK65687.1 SDR family oxidoreductase [Sapientia aquatica]
MKNFSELQLQLNEQQSNWVITGVAGFIGSNLLEFLLKHNQKVVGLDNFSTGYQHNLDQVREIVGSQKWANFSFVQGDIRDLDTCQQVCKGADYVLHHAAIGSVPRSIEDPLLSNANNVTGYLNMLVAARDQKVRRFVYAASSSTYGDHPDLPKVESVIGKPLSPYAVTKYVNELYADVFHRCYGLSSIGLRYFNVFGPRQDPNGAYAAVIPIWIAALIRNQELKINGDGSITRDFCYVENVIQANVLAALSTNEHADNQIFNVALSDRTSLLDLYKMIRDVLVNDYPHLQQHQPTFLPFRTGDIPHSQADISKAQTLLAYAPQYKVDQGLQKAINWYKQDLT